MQAEVQYAAASCYAFFFAKSWYLILQVVKTIELKVLLWVFGIVKDLGVIVTVLVVC